MFSNKPTPRVWRNAPNWRECRVNQVELLILLQMSAVIWSRETKRFETPLGSGQWYELMDELRGVKK